MRFSVLAFLTAAVAVQAANNVAQKVVYSASGVASVVGNHFGCAHSEFSVPRVRRQWDYGMLIRVNSPTSWAAKPTWVREARFH